MTTAEIAAIVNSAGPWSFVAVVAAFAAIVFTTAHRRIVLLLAAAASAVFSLSMVATVSMMESDRVERGSPPPDGYVTSQELASLPALSLLFLAPMLAVLYAIHKARPTTPRTTPSSDERIGPTTSA